MSDVPRFEGLAIIMKRLSLVNLSVKLGNSKMVCGVTSGLRRSGAGGDMSKTVRVSVQWAVNESKPNAR